MGVIDLHLVVGTFAALISRSVCDEYLHRCRSQKLLPYFLLQFSLTLLCLPVLVVWYIYLPLTAEIVPQSGVLILLSGDLNIL